MSVKKGKLYFKLIIIIGFLSILILSIGYYYTFYSYFPNLRPIINQHNVNFFYKFSPKDNFSFENNAILIRNTPIYLNLPKTMLNKNLEIEITYSNKEPLKLFEILYKSKQGQEKIPIENEILNLWPGYCANKKEILFCQKEMIFPSIDSFLANINYMIGNLVVYNYEIKTKNKNLKIKKFDKDINFENFDFMLAKYKPPVIKSGYKLQKIILKDIIDTKLEFLIYPNIEIKILNLKIISKITKNL